MSLPERDARSQRRFNKFFLVFYLILFPLMLLITILRTLGVLSGPAPGPVDWCLILAGCAATLYALYDFRRHSGEKASK